MTLLLLVKMRDGDAAAAVCFTFGGSSGMTFTGTTAFSYGESAAFTYGGCSNS